MHLRFAIEGEGILLDSFGWPEQRAFIDQLVAALEAMPQGPRADEVGVERLSPGSVVVHMRTPPTGRAAVRMLERGPNLRWTRQQRQRVDGLYSFLRERSATLRAGERVLRPVVLPEVSPQWTLREIGSLRGEVILVGGRKMRAHIDFDLEGLVVCDGDPAVVRRLAESFGEPVVVDGEITRDAATGALLGMNIHGVHPAPRRRPPGEVFAEIRGIIGDAAAPWSAERFVREARR